MNKPHLVCPNCGVYNELNESKCWKCKRPISEEEREAAKFTVEDSAAELSEGKQPNTKVDSQVAITSQIDDTALDYKTSIVVSKCVAAIGWIVCAVSFLLVIGALVSAGKFGLVALAPAIGLLMGGLALVIAGQSSRAIMDNANYSKQILAELRKGSQIV